MWPPSRKVCAVLACLFLGDSCPAVFRNAAVAEPPSPAAVADAQQVIDLAALPRFNKNSNAAAAGVSHLSYQASGSVKEVFDFHQKQLVAKGWQEAPQSYVTEQSASATFSSKGYIVSLAVVPTGEPKSVSVMLQNHGNVDLSKLPLPAGSTPLYAGQVNAIYTTSTSVEDSLKFIRTALQKGGWSPYGEAGNQYFFRQNAVRLSVNIMSAPAQAGKTMITYSAEQLSAELPAPAEAIGLQYSDSTYRLMFDSKSSQDDIIKFYRDALSAGKWKATLDKPIKIDFHDVVIFRNPAKDLIELHLYPVEEKLRAELQWKSAAQVEEEEARAKAAIDAKKKKDQPKEPIQLKLPEGASQVQAAAARIEFNLNTGTARTAITKYKAALQKDGWKVDRTVIEFQDATGSVTMKKGAQELEILYIDPGFIPAQVTITGTGGDLKVQK